MKMYDDEDDDQQTSLSQNATIHFTLTEQVQLQ